MPRRHLVTIKVVGRPATFATAHEAPWKIAVRDAVTLSGVHAGDNNRYSVRMEFRTATPKNTNEVWDIDNLVKPTLDAMEGVFGKRTWRGLEQAADDRVDHIEALKRRVLQNEEPGATIDVWILDDEEIHQP